MNGKIWMVGAGALMAVAVFAAGCGSGGATSATTTTQTPAAVAPTFSPAAGSYTGTQAVTISTTTPSATIYYTTDGSTPTTGSNVYSGPVSVSTTETLNAIAVATGYTASTSQKAAYTVSAKLNAIVSDDTTQDWSTIGVKVLSIALVPSSGGSNVTIYTAPSTPPMINLVQLDQLGEILGNVTVPTGTYSQAVLTLSANNANTSSPSACDVELVASADPESGFDEPAGTAVPCNQIVIAGAQGTAGSMTVPLTVNLATPLTVTAAASNALDLEFNLNDPALIVEHYPANATAPTWVVNFNGPVRHHPHSDLSKLILRHHYGQVASVSSDNSSISINPAFPALPIASPETATVDTNNTLTILADATNGTLFYDLDNSTAPTTINSFTSVASELPGLYTRIAVRYQTNGTLTATRIYASKNFNTIWANPEGHVLHVNTTTNVMHVSTENGGATAVAIGPDTAFYFQSGDTAIGTGTAFFDGKTQTNGLPNLARGFKVNVTLDPTSTSSPKVAQSVEIEVARYDGTIGNPTTTDFSYTRTFAMADGRGGNDDYSGLLNYASGATVDQEGNTDSNGFYWWDFTFPTLEDTASTAVSDFVNATDNSVNFGGTVGALKPYGLSNATWGGDQAASNTWAAMWTILMPVPAPIGQISSAFSSTTSSFAYTVPVAASAPQGTAAANPVTVDLSTASGSATLVYQVDRQSNVITITPQSIGAAGPALLANVPVKVFGVPQGDGSLKAYVLFYYTHTASTK